MVARRLRYLISGGRKDLILLFFLINSLLENSKKMNNDKEILFTIRNNLRKGFKLVLEGSRRFGMFQKVNKGFQIVLKDSKRF